MLCLDTQQMSLCLLKEGPHTQADETISLVGCSTVPLAGRLHSQECCGSRSPVLQLQHCLGCGLGACQVGLVPDSGLDASSQYPSLGSFTTPVARLMVETRGVPQGFLSYYHVMPSSRPSLGEMLAVGKDPPEGTQSSSSPCGPQLGVLPSLSLGPLTGRSWAATPIGCSVCGRRVKPTCLTTV